VEKRGQGPRAGSGSTERIEKARRRLSEMMGYPVCAAVIGTHSDGTPHVCRMGKHHLGPHV
jgi:hypothetical protein